jgi:hypothetical protein
MQGLPPLFEGRRIQGRRVYGRIPPRSVFSACASAASSSISSHSVVSKDSTESGSRRQQLKRTMLDTSNATLRRRLGNAKSEVKERYDGDPNFWLLSRNENYVTWNDYGKDGVPVFACYFVSPQWELFPAGRMIRGPERERYKEFRNGLHWYGRKQDAAQAAAGRAMDCFKFRDAGCPEVWTRSRHCNELPRKRKDYVALPDQYPEAVDKIEILLQRLLIMK